MKAAGSGQERSTAPAAPGLGSVPRLGSCSPRLQSGAGTGEQRGLRELPGPGRGSGCGAAVGPRAAGTAGLSTAPNGRLPSHRAGRGGGQPRGGPGGRSATRPAAEVAAWRPRETPGV